MLILLLFVSSILAQRLFPLHTIKLKYQQSLGVFTGNIRIGNQLENKNIIIDTGSSITAVKPFQNPFYHIECQNRCTSCTFLDNLCLFSINYLDNTYITGEYYKDYLLFGDDIKDELLEYSKVPIYIGIISNGGFSDNSIDGILGLSPNTDSDTKFPNIVDALYKKEQNFSSLSFSICLGNETGYLSIGQSDTNYNNTVYYNHQINQYQLPLSNIQIGNYVITHQFYTTIDSGSTLVFIDQHFYEQIINNLTSTFNFTYLFDKQICFNASNDQSQFPNITFNFLNNITINWQPEYYLINILNQLCLGILPIRGSNILILGQNWMRNQEILFHRERKSITFKQTNCDIQKVSTELSQDEIDQLKQTKQSLSKEEDSQQNKINIAYLIMAIFVIFIILIIITLKRIRYEQKQAKYTEFELIGSQQNHSQHIRNNQPNQILSQIQMFLQPLYQLLIIHFQFSRVSRYQLCLLILILSHYRHLHV